MTKKDLLIKLDEPLKEFNEMLESLYDDEDVDHNTIVLLLGAIGQVHNSIMFEGREK